MTRVIVDEQTQAKLGNLSEVLEICDSSGQLLGVFHPVDRSLYQTIQLPVSNEELERRAAQGGGRPLSEILADLRKLG